MSARRCRRLAALLLIGCCVRAQAQQGSPPDGHCEPEWHRSLQECPDFGLKLGTDRICGCTGTVITTCAEFAYDRTGRAVWMDSAQCGEPRPDEEITLQKKWTWDVHGVAVEPPSGEGRCASFLLKEPGIGYVEFKVVGSNTEWPQCDVTRFKQQPISAHGLALKLARPYLGIRMTDPIGEPRDSMVARTIFGPSPACKSYEWELDSVAELEGPRGDDGSWVTITEQGVASERYRRDEIRVTRHCTDVTNFTVVRVDVNVGMMEYREETEGRLIRLNDNDSDHSGIPDLQEAPLHSSDPDLYPVLVVIQPTDLPAEEVVRINSSLPLYEDTRKEVPAAAAYPVSRLPLTLYAEGVTVGAEEFVEVHHGGSPAVDRAKFKVYRLGMVPDFNHDRRITDQDKALMLTNGPFRFWVNDDDDRGDVAEGDSDVPGQDARADHGNGVVDGRCDLTDFFPVWLDLHDMLSILSDEFGLECRLSQADGAVKIVYTDLSRSDAGNYLVQDGVRCGPGLSHSAHEATSVQVTPQGVKLDEIFLSLIASDRNKGVVLVEATRPSTAPLLLEIRIADSTVCTLSLDLSLSGVEQMYRWVNLRDFVNPGQVPPPANSPDSSSNGKNLLFVHGFSVSASDARAWNAEVFKRLYWSGSKAMFHGVSWFGNKTRGLDPLYQENVTNAFHAAPALRDYVADLAGESVIMAHSLGNMVVSSAIADHDMQVGTYIMCNAAVPAEAYDALVEQDGRMVNHWWEDYDSRTWAANWHKLFSDTLNSRRRLTWKDRFADSSRRTTVWAFFSSGDEVFGLDDSPGLLSGIFHVRWWFIVPTGLNVRWGRFSWQKQELMKGTSYDRLVDLGTTRFAGWGFNSDVVGPDADGMYQVEALYSPEGATDASDGDLRRTPLFVANPEWLVNDDPLNEDQINEVVAMGIPALTPAAGAVPLPPGFVPQHRQIDVDDVSMKANYANWPTRAPPDVDRWLHNDMKSVAYPFTYLVYDSISAAGHIK